MAKEAGYDVSRKCAYADDVAIMHAYGDWKVVEGVLTKDMATVGRAGPSRCGDQCKT